MEGILVLLGLYLVFRVIAKKGRTTLNTLKQQMEANIDGQPGEPPPPVLQKFSTRPFTTEQKREAQRKAEPQQYTAYTKTEQRMERTERQGMKTTLRTDVIRGGYAGSLGDHANEGRLSQAGAAMAEGRALPFGEGRPGDVAGETGIDARLHAVPDAKAAGAAGILPVAWSGNDLIRSFVASEILAKPRKRSDYHG